MAVDGIRIDDLDPTVLPSLTHVVAAMKDGATVKLTIAQFISLIRSNSVIWDDPTLRPSADNLLEVLQLLDTDIAGLATAITAAITTAVTTARSDPWAMMPIGAVVPLQTHITGVIEPPVNQAYRFAKLTAGLTGGGGYNNGVLSGESVSGSAPLVLATANVSLIGSPIIGQTIRLLNSEQRFLRGHTTAGNLQDSDNLAHVHSISDPTHSHAVAWSGTSNTDLNSGGGNYRIAATGDGANPPINSLRALAVSTGITGANSTGGTEARPRNMGVTYFVRVK